MPLIILCGLPGSGKSRRAEELRAALSAEEEEEGGGGGGERRVFVPLEPPDSRHRWDRPLFAAPHDPAQPLPLPEIRAALFERRPPPPNQSTRAQPLQPAAFLHRLDRLTQDVAAALVAAQRDGVQPGQVVPLAVEGLGQESPGLLLSRPVGLPELSRLRRQFLSYAKMHPGEGEESLPRLGSMFLQYLSSNLQ
ncbi:PREDICTED: protein KTI12 homolog [Gekko japonicus]|uniref:Protein KTI12 homolog n=1 Tax=Gekko japonicus TaxID=146911 RepID=A0ABM1KS67_GEKJA|nr:PREDICTED: protein KTI12 homolog [Gekko japonicus]